MPKKKRVENCKYLPSNLKSRRIAMGLKQEDVARALNLDRTSITYYERGAHEPSIMVLLRLAKILQTDIVTLLSPRPDALEDRRYVTVTNPDNLKAATVFGSPGSVYNADGNSTEELLEPKPESPLPESELPKASKKEIDLVILSRNLTDEQIDEICQQMKKIGDENISNSLK